MKISYNWLKEYLKCDMDPQQMSVVLTNIGLEVESVESIETIRGNLQGVVVGEVLSCSKHPDADKLNITTVNVGETEPLQIVCGAPNVAVGQKVLVATINTTLYPKGEVEGFKIKRSKIRGVESMGMICAADELGIGEDHSGIMVLESSAVVGTPAIDFLEIENQTSFEIGLTPNRSDAASHYGVARDLAAYLKSNDIDYEFISASVDTFNVDNNDYAIKVTIEDPIAVPRYAGVTMTGIKVAPSPDWLQKRLKSIGINPKNNIVDITNFVLHETGQPLHAFDASHIAASEINVKCVAENTSFTTLDGVVRKLSSQDVMICNANEPMAIAGVMGGVNSGVSEQTDTIFIESAYFNPVRIRKTAKRHSLSTDASFRYERGADPEMVIYALKRAALLVRELASGKVSSQITDIYANKIEPFRFDVSLQRINALIGKNIGEQTIKTIIDSLGIEITNQNGDTLSVAVPAYRVDVQREADLVEDLLRIYGYNNIEIPVKVKSTLSYAPKPDKEKIINMVSDMLAANGFIEMMSNSLTKSAYYENLNTFPAENCVRILNPLSNDLNVMRQTLLFSALEAIQLNSNRRNSDLKLYELGNCYQFDKHAFTTEKALAPYSESYHLSIIMTGAVNQPSWNVKSEPTGFYHLRSVVEKILNKFGLDIYDLKYKDLPSDIYREGICLMLNGKDFINMGVVANSLRSTFDTKGDVFHADIDLGMLLKTTRKHSIAIEELSKFPEVKRDLALLVDIQVKFSDLREAALNAERKLLKKISLFDVYEGDKLPEGKKSYALSFVIEDKSRTLTDEMIERVMNNIISALEKKTGAEIRK